jgi:hypothetical protein
LALPAEDPPGIVTARAASSPEAVAKDGRWRAKLLDMWMTVPIKWKSWRNYWGRAFMMLCFTTVFAYLETSNIALLAVCAFTVVCCALSPIHGLPHPVALLLKIKTACRPQ